MKVDYIINFDFDEVNSAVFRNAQIYMRKKHSKDRICVIVPYYFKKLFSNADIVAVIGKNLCKRFSIEDYKTILDYGVFLDNENLINTIKKKILNARDLFFWRMIELSKFFGKNYQLLFYKNLYFSNRQRKFFINNGLEKYCINSLYKYFTDFKYIRVSDFIDVKDFSIGKFDLQDYFAKNFLYLNTMIEEGKFYTSILKKENLTSQLNNITNSKQEYIENFLTSFGPKIVLRTRNFKKKAKIHNSRKDILKPLIENLLAKGIMVLNLGCPLLELDIKNNLYCEIQHSLTFEEELAICQLADANIMTAQAGLFVGFAASLINIIQIDDEWSQNCLDRPISLFNARKKAGLKDIDIRDLLENNQYNLAAQKIIKNLPESKSVLKNFLANNNLNSHKIPEEIYL